jgi:hypothetical protein
VYSSCRAAFARAFWGPGNYLAANVGLAWHRFAEADVEGRAAKRVLFGRWLRLVAGGPVAVRLRYGRALATAAIRRP